MIAIPKLHLAKKKVETRLLVHVYENELVY